MPHIPPIHCEFSHFAYLCICFVFPCGQRPGKSRGQADSVIQAKLNLRLWLGKLDAYRPCSQLLEGIPEGYEVVTGPDNQKAPLPPTELIYTGESVRKLDDSNCTNVN